MLKKIFNPQHPRFHWLALALIFILGWIVYANCLTNEMFWDDDDFILKNRYIKDFAFWPLWFKENLVAGSYFVSNYWRPALLYVFSNEWHWFKDAVIGWHTISVLWHIADGALIYVLFNRLFNNRWVSCLTAIIFVIHPTHNEAVVYVNSLGDSLSTFFVLLSLIAYSHFRKQNRNPFLSRSYWAALFMFPLAVMSKETGFVMCALVPLMDFIMLQQGIPFWPRVVRVAKTTWPLILMAIYYVYLRGTVLNFSNSFNFYNESNPFSSNIFLRLLTFFKAITQYAGFLFIPYELRVERQLPWATNPFELDVLWGGFIVAGLIWAFFKYWQQKPWVSFGIGWFFVAIAPASNILVPINAVLYEHFLYAPMIGLTAVVVFGLSHLNQNAVLKKIIIGALIGYIGFFMVMGIRRNMDWHTAVGFYEKLVKYSPSYRVINNLGMEYADIGNHAKAEFWYKKAIEMDPNNCVAYHNIAGTYRDTGRTDLAIAAFSKAIELNPKFIFSYRALAQLYWNLGDYKQAYRYLNVVYQYDPSDLNVHRAMEELTRILSQQPLTGQKLP